MKTHMAGSQLKKTVAKCYVQVALANLVQLHTYIPSVSLQATRFASSRNRLLTCEKYEKLIHN